MMTLQILSESDELIHEIADFLLNENLIANAFITDNAVCKVKDKHGDIVVQQQYSLKGISKSLLFTTIDEKLKEKFGDKTPLIYSEPIILIDTKNTEELVKNLVKV